MPNAARARVASPPAGTALAHATWECLPGRVRLGEVRSICNVLCDNRQRHSDMKFRHLEVQLRPAPAIAGKEGPHEVRWEGREKRRDANVDAMPDLTCHAPSTTLRVVPLAASRGRMSQRVTPPPLAS